jgi:hypothetical protein
MSFQLTVFINVFCSRSLLPSLLSWMNVSKHEEERTDALSRNYFVILTVLQEI